jgi:hypothetical protein
MADQISIPRVEDVVSVGSRISWGAILAGAALSLGLYSLFGIIGGAVGLSVRGRVDPTTLKDAVIAWAFLILLVSVFVGGVVTSQFTVGETKTEAMLYGVIMWAVLFGVLTTVGAHAGFSILHSTNAAGTESWDQLARDAGVPADQIAAWRRQAGAPAVATDTPEARQEATKRLAWYGFAATLASIIAAAVGAIVGAGPRFKVIRVTTRV